ncbi:hypothetical protein FB379_1651 [Aeribacillus composti]|nr:hypothetical protein FB379_1651 [Aeribacillus composti]
MLREEQTINEIAAKYELSPVMVSRWKAEFLERSSMVFEIHKFFTAKIEYITKKFNVNKTFSTFELLIEFNLYTVDEQNH